MSEILKLRIDRNVAGNKIPYDVLYFVPRTQRSIIPRLWDFALVMPFEASFKEVVYKLPLSKVSYLKQHRDDDALNMSVGIPKDKDNVKVVWDDLKIKYALDNCLVVVPMLVSRKVDEYKPRYLTSKQWFIRLISKGAVREKRVRSKEALFKAAMSAQEVSKFAPGISDLAYLTTPFPAPDDIIRPLCSVCPRSLQHLQGACIPGMQICYETLNLNLKAPAALNNPPEVVSEEIPF